MTKVLIMGKTGMLGSMLNYYLSSLEYYDIFTTSRQQSTESNLFFNAETPDLKTLNNFITNNGIEYVLNAIGIINKYCRDDDKEGVKRAEKVNTRFPHELARLTSKLGVRTIQIATDCVYDGKLGNYNENSPHSPVDVYGKTKSLGEVTDGSVLNIRCSIVGPEIKTKESLLEWFLSQTSQVSGFKNHRWNGITTLRFVKLIDSLIQKHMYDELIEKSPVYHFVPDYVLTKYEMLELFKKVFSKKIEIKPINAEQSIDRTLATEFDDLNLFPKLNFEEDVTEVKRLIDKDFYSFPKTH